MLPDIASQQWYFVFGDGIAGILALPDVDLVTQLDQPAPTGAEDGDGFFVEGFLEIVKGAKATLNCIGDRAGRLATALR